MVKQLHTRLQIDLVVLDESDAVSLDEPRIRPSGAAVP
jgi:hypothetical protein